MATKEQIESFYRFANERLTSDGSAKTIDELYEEWRMENLTPRELAENVAAVQASADDMKAGETGRDASYVEKELRNDLRLP